jgi:hypothetical protein
LYSQDLKIYHGRQGESELSLDDKRTRIKHGESIPLKRNASGVVTISIENPNPFFYTYEIKTEEVTIVEDYSNQFSDLVKLLSAVPEFIGSVEPFYQKLAPIATPRKFDVYINILKNLHQQLKEVNSYINISDNPETINEALNGETNQNGYGFRSAVKKIESISNDKGNFGSSTLEDDLNNFLEDAIKDGSLDSILNRSGDSEVISIYISTFKVFNKWLSEQVSKIKEVTKSNSVVIFKVPVKENIKTTVSLIIKNKNTNSKRDIFDEKIVTVTPFYVRKRFEVVPVVNLVFQQNTQSFFIENNLVQSSPDDEAKFNIGAMALMNFASFGEQKEYGVGFGIGYSIQPNGNSSSFFAVPSLSYKNIVRVGFGFGYNLAPVGLKDGAKVGEPLPPNISNISDIIDYKRKLAAVFTISISGFSF